MRSEFKITVGLCFLAFAQSACAQWTVTNLNPSGATRSWSLSASGSWQVGDVTRTGVQRASLWTGTAASWIDLSPSGATTSRAEGVSGSQQVGLPTLAVCGVPVDGAARPRLGWI